MTRSGSRPRPRGRAALALVCLVLAGCSWATPIGAHAGRPGPHGTATTPVDRTPWPADLRPAPRPRCVNAPPGWLAHEDSRPAGVALPAVAAAVAHAEGAVQGYLDRAVVACGASDAVHLSAPVASTVVVAALRVGDYGHGLDARVVWHSGVLHVRPGRGRPATAHATAEERWPTALTLRPDAHWAPGLYLLRLSPARGPGPSSYQSFVVEDSGPPAACVAVESDLTQLAYDTAGGTSLYRGPGRTVDAIRGHRAWFASPHRGLAGGGLLQLLARDVPLAVVLDHDGVAAAWTTDTGLDATPSVLRGRGCVILPGHSEYWTARAYAALRAAVDGGTNLAVLGGNEIYWQARLLRDAAGEVRWMVVYRSARLDPETDPAARTLQWRDPALGLDPARLTGLGMAGVGVTADATVRATPGWLTAGTGLRTGQVLAGVYGNEADGPHDPSLPAHDVIVLDGSARNQWGVLVELGTAYHVAASGARVFDAGTTEWLCAVTGTCADGPRPARTRAVLARITANVLDAFDRPLPTPRGTG